MNINGSEPVLRINDLKVYYETPRGPVKAVDGMSLFVNRGERFGFVGESGCGKTTTAMAILRMITHPGRIVGGQIVLADRDLVPLTEDQMQQVRWRGVSLVPQGAMSSLNPVIRIYEQIADAIEAHEGKQPRRALAQRVGELLATVGLKKGVADMFPHELSGGMKQRVCVAMAIALEPKLIIADEPTSALDVVVQRIVTQTLIEVTERIGAALILIGHDMGLQAQIVQRLAIMYAGHLAEMASTEQIFEAPKHPYTQALIASVPSPTARKPTLALPGLPPALLNPPPGCVFHPRCSQAMDICRQAVPALTEIEPGQHVACHLYH